jgi:hypothetical protein
MIVGSILKANQRGCTIGKDKLIDQHHNAIAAKAALLKPN